MRTGPVRSTEAHGSGKRTLPYAITAEGSCGAVPYETCLVFAETRVVGRGKVSLWTSKVLRMGWKPSVSNRLCTTEPMHVLTWPMAPGVSVV